MRSQRLPANGNASIFHLSKSNDLGDVDRAGEAAIVRPSALHRARRGSGTVQPRTAGALHLSRVRFEVAEHRGAF
jgi:hypothetical protein